MTTGTKRRAQEARERAAAARHEGLRREQRRAWLLRGGVIAAVVAILGAVLGIALTRNHSTSTPDGPLTTGNVAAAGTALPPWTAPADTATRAEAASLSLGPMGTAQHYHAHLDVLVDGHAVPVAADIGVDARSGAMTGLHTHDTTGIVHIEATHANDRFTLGQLFTEWNVRLTARQIGGLRDSAARRWSVYVNGAKVTTDPAAIVLRSHQEIALVYGAPSATVKVPSSYHFAEGE